MLSPFHPWVRPSVPLNRRPSAVHSTTLLRSCAYGVNVGMKEGHLTALRQSLPQHRLHLAEVPVRKAVEHHPLVRWRWCFFRENVGIGGFFRSGHEKVCGQHPRLKMDFAETAVLPRIRQHMVSST